MWESILFLLFTIVSILVYLGRRVLIIVAQAWFYHLGLWNGPKKASTGQKIKQPKLRRKKVAVIGSGPSGVSAAKCLMDEGHEVVVYEKSNCVGGNWVYSDKEKAHSSIYDTVVVNTSKEHMCFSDFPLPKEFPVFLPHADVKEYFESYVMHFKIYPHIKFHTQVVWVEPLEEGNRSTAWRVTSVKVDDEGVEQGEKDTEQFDAVVVCNGHHWSPRWPRAKFPGQEDFEGEILHSHSFKSAKKFAGKKVVVVGVGGSGCDIATDCSKLSPHVYLSTRSGCFVIPKWYFGKPFDHVSTTRFMAMLPLLPKLLFMLAMSYVVKGCSAEYGLRQKFLKRTLPAVNQEILSCIVSKQLQVKPHIKRMKKNSVVFHDDSEVEVDAIIFATGYHVEFPFMDSKKLIGYAKEGDNDICLYKYVVPLDYDSLFFVGLIQSLGGFFPIAELQSRWVAALLSGKKELPSRNERKNDIKRKREQLAKEWVKESKYMIQVDFVPYCDELADLIGVRPKLWKHWDILWELLFGVVTPVQFRLDGPGKWKGAGGEIKDIYKRSKHPDEHMTRA